MKPFDSDLLEARAPVFARFVATQDALNAAATNAGLHLLQPEHHGPWRAAKVAADAATGVLRQFDFDATKVMFGRACARALAVNREASMADDPEWTAAWDELRAARERYTRGEHLGPIGG